MQNAIWLFTPTISGTPASFPTSNGSTSTTVGDGQGYLVTGLNVGTQTATLSTNYQGTTGCGKGFIWGYPQNDGGFLGWGMQPTYMGHAGQAFGLSAMAMTGYDAPSELLFNRYMDDAVAGWLSVLCSQSWPRWTLQQHLHGRMRPADLSK